MKILFFGDSITSAERTRNPNDFLMQYGAGFVTQIVGKLHLDDPISYEILNRGIGGHSVVDLYARIKSDVWNEVPDVLNILVGVNDVALEVLYKKGVDLDRYKKVYRMIIEETQVRLPNTKIILMEPFVLHGSITDKNYNEFLQIYEYAKVVENLAKEYGLFFLPLQLDLEVAFKRYGEGVVLIDGIHPTMLGSGIIASKWYKLFKSKVEKSISR